MYQPAPWKPYQESHVPVWGQKLQAEDKFTYPGGEHRRLGQQ